MYRRAISIFEHAPAPYQLRLSETLAHLGSLWSPESYPEAEKVYLRALALRESLDPDHRGIATILNNLATLSYERNHLMEAESLYLRAKSMGETELGRGNPQIATTLVSLGSVTMS